MSISSEQFLQNNALELLSTSGNWMLVRHQWLIDNMRCILTGERTPPLNDLCNFDDMLANNQPLPENLMQCFNEVRHLLEGLWAATIKVSHPMSGLTIFEQLNQYQTAAHGFMQASREANQRLWHAFTMRDPLTGALTRQSLSDALTTAIHHAQRHQTPCSIALLDQDHFKSINDRWGHIAGDMVLAKTADIIHQHLKPNEQLFRYGGDEWLILMPECSNADAQEKMAQIQLICASHPFYTKNNEIIHSTFSFGIAELTENTSYIQWMMDADFQLYAKKLYAQKMTELIDTNQDASWNQALADANKT